MKNIYSFTYLLVTLLFLGKSGTFAQEMLQGGNMESEDAWTVTHLNGNSPAVLTFNYTDLTPADGDGACLQATVTNSDPDNYYSQTLLYQSVTLERGETYEFTGAIKDNAGWDGFWLEVFISGVAVPDEGTDDYGPSDDLVYVIKPSTDDNGCDTENMDGTIEDKACKGDGIAFFDGEGDTTVFVGIKFGAWGGDKSFDFLLDELSLMKSGTNTIANTLSDIKVYPSSMQNELNIQLKSKINDVKVINLLGQTALIAKDVNSENITLDVSGIQTGIYCIVVSDIDGKSGTIKTIKK